MKRCILTGVALAAAFSTSLALVWSASASASGVPMLTEVVPHEGSKAGGTTVVIIGENLEDATEIMFGDSLAPKPYLRDTATEIELKTPAHAVGTVEVCVTNAEDIRQCTVRLYTYADTEKAPFFAECYKTAKNTRTKKYEGIYTERSCHTHATPTEVSEGKYNDYDLRQVTEGAPVTAKGKTKEAILLTASTTGKPWDIVCKDGTFTGDVYDSSSGGRIKGDFVFSGCRGKSATEEATCQNGEIDEQPVIDYGGMVTSPGELRWGEGPALETKPEVGSADAPTFECGTETIDLGGVLWGTLENTAKGVNVTWGIAKGEQEDDSIFELEEPKNAFTEFHWYNAGDAEATVAAKSTITLTAVSVRKLSEI